MKVLWLIPARSGSKGIPDKCIKILGDKPLIAHRIDQVAPILDDSTLWISTDSAEYATIASSYGCPAPFLRPKSLSGDFASSNDVTLHAMNFATQQGLHFDYVGLLQPTSPFVKTKHLVQALDTLQADTSAKAIVAVKETKTHTSLIQSKQPYLTTISANLSQIKSVARQQLETQITPCGGFYIAEWDFFLNSKTFFTPRTRAFLLEGHETLDIDVPLDWKIAEAYVKDT